MRLSEQLIAAIDLIAARTDRTRSEVGREIVANGLKTWLRASKKRFPAGSEKLHSDIDFLLRVEELIG